jgi:ATP-dependent exoDNAse (exonuclease V) beta subunit
MNLEAQLLQIIEQQQQQLKEQQKQQEQALQLIQAQNRTIDELENYNNKLVKHCNQLNEKENELINIIKKLQNPKLSEDLLQNLENSLKQRLQSHLEQLVTGLNLKNEINEILPTMIYTEIEADSTIDGTASKKLDSVQQYHENSRF